MNNKIVLITGATSGIGLACAEQFAHLGARLILIGRRTASLQAVAADLKQQYAVDILPITMDVTQHMSVQAALQNLPLAWQAIDVLVNNAGLSLGLDKLNEGLVVDWEAMIDTNIKGLLYITRYVLPLMLQRQIGHIINIGSVAGYEVYPGAAVYCATKFAVRALSQGIKMDVHGTPLRVSEIAPGMVKTEFSAVRFKGDQQRAEAVYQDVDYLTAADIANAVVYCATRPAHVNIQSMSIMPTDQSAATMVHRHRS